MPGVGWGATGRRFKSVQPDLLFGLAVNSYRFTRRVALQSSPKRVQNLQCLTEAPALYPLPASSEDSVSNRETPAFHDMMLATLTRADVMPSAEELFEQRQGS